MLQSTNAEHDLRIRNVELHARGPRDKDPVHGTLCLYRHHLVFKYTPGVSPDSATINTKESKTFGQSPRSSRSLDHGPHRSNDASPKKSDPSKEIWIPYPMINYCMLRPTNAAGSRRVGENQEETQNEGLFPPTRGTSIYTPPQPPTDSSRVESYSSLQHSSTPINAISKERTMRKPAIRIRRRDFQMLAFHFSHDGSTEKSANDDAREVFYCLRSRCVVSKIQDMHAFHFKAPREELRVENAGYDARREFARMGISGKAVEGPGRAWRVTDINQNYEYSPTYPSVLCVPQVVSDNILKYGASFRSKCRIPALTYLHSNGGSISRSSQPMVGLKSKRSPQDERLVSAIFSSHTPSQPSPGDSPTHDPDDALSGRSEQDVDVPTLPISQSDPALDQKSVDDPTPSKRIYGSTRRNLIMDARPKMNAIANLTSGGGFEDVSNYCGPPGTVVERMFLGIANIHVMRKSLDKVIESFANSDYTNFKPNAELLRNSGWLTHIAGLLGSAETVTQVVGLGGSHVLVHCSDGWDRTSQVAALAEIMLDPFYRTLSGFITLVQKDFLSFGHKFNHRHGIQGSDKWFDIENERVMPPRPQDGDNADSAGMNSFGAKALSGAKNWFEKNRNNLFRQQNDSKEETDESDSRSASPPPNSILHSPATSSTKKDREHKTELQEIAPIFHQFLDAVFQLQYHHPNAFEFNERFLRRLFYQAYAGQYGEFLFNTEKDRTEHAGNFASVWPHFLSRRREFTNPDYVAKVSDPLLFPVRNSHTRELDVRWWSSLFGRQDEDMNTARSLAPPDPPAKTDTPSLNAQMSAVSLEDVADDATPRIGPQAAAIGEAQSVPSLDALQVDQAAQIAEPTSNKHSTQSREASQPNFEAPTSLQTKEEHGIEKGSSFEQEEIKTPRPTDAQPMNNSDPLGVSSNVNELGGTRLDFAAFAKQSAYKD